MKTDRMRSSARADATRSLGWRLALLVVALFVLPIVAKGLRLL